MKEEKKKKRKQSFENYYSVDTRLHQIGCGVCNVHVNCNVNENKGE